MDIHALTCYGFSIQGTQAMLNKLIDKQGMESFEVARNMFRRRVLLQGGPPKLSFFRRLLPLLSSAGATGLLVEYEDFFPYDGLLRNLSSRSAWSPAEVTDLLEVAHSVGLQVIPLVQTLGHLEFALKLTEHVHLRENPELPDTLCPSAPAARDLVAEMIRQVRAPDNRVIGNTHDSAVLALPTDASLPLRARCLF